MLAGYALTPVGQALIALAAGWPLILVGRLVSWFGKGLRGPLRDAIVVQAIAPEARGRAFGFHRAMDTVGAVVGPLLGITLLGWAQRRIGDSTVSRAAGGLKRGIGLAGAGWESGRETWRGAANGGEAR